MERGHKFKYWFGSLLDWLAEGQIVWNFLFISLTVVVYMAVSGGSELSLRIAGMVFQILGILSVFKGIQETRELFGHPGLTSMLLQWFRRRPRFKQRTFEASGLTASITMSASGRGYMSANAALDAPLENRVEVLEKNLEHLRQQLYEMRGELEQEIRKSTESLQEEKNTRAEEDRKVLSKLETTETGGLHVSAMGALWILFGTICGSIPRELSMLF